MEGRHRRRFAQGGAACGCREGRKRGRPGRTGSHPGAWRRRHAIGLRWWKSLSGFPPPPPHVGKPHGTRALRFPSLAAWLHRGSPPSPFGRLHTYDVVY
ncbi:hypothetical protein LX32DRAFT_40618 [Colletotrichum zoysiae]|uniref:Uncharacterized protein n=1 Tax=Colletotrichum zoysiae TaxID=1216348 RepID=A0AAD9HDI0_9PEZI|nr:hypothetical protein LX32DRAFT_40618 [Colletotrichum zoysiae]